MKVLIACEFTGVVRDAFLEHGHDAVSCDLLPSENPGPHIQEDVLLHLDEGWDLMIAFPPCTHLCRAGARFWAQKKADGRMGAAIRFVKQLRYAPIPKIAIENPTGVLWKALRKPDQIIEPYMFGDPYQKKTCLWLYGLPRLTPTKIVQPVHHWVDTGTTRGMCRSSKDRSRTFPGIARAMAEQWGGNDNQID
jgi:hypothetical protein